MKKLLNFVFVTILMLSNTIAFAQSNNPYNQRGVDYMNSLGIISSDVKTRGVNDFNQETLDYYARRIPLQTQASAEMAATIIRTLKTPGLTLASFLDNSSLSTTAKQVVKDIFLNRRDQDLASLRSKLVSKTDEIKNMNLPGGEKEVLLSMVAITYQAVSTADPLRAPNSSMVHCYLFGPGGTQLAPCWVAGTLIGAFIGWELCGIWCALGGGLIGGIIGALT